MKGPRTGSLRTLVWAVGAVACVSYYAAKTTRLPHANPAGRETALFPRWNVDLKLLESPSGARWVLSPTPPAAPPPVPGPQPAPPAWPPAVTSPRRVTLWQPAGTWSLQGRALRRVWRFSAERWADERHLRGTLENPAPELLLTLDLNTGRTAIRPWTWEAAYNPGDYEGELYDEEPDLVSVLNSPLEQVPGDLRFSKQQRFTAGGRPLYLLWAPWTRGERHPVYAASDDAAPRLLRLLDDGVPLDLSRDGRTLFFSRGNVLWRLDLRKPLPALLDDVPLPALPEPSLD